MCVHDLLALQTFQEQLAGQKWGLKYFAREAVNNNHLVGTVKCSVITRFDAHTYVHCRHVQYGGSTEYTELQPLLSGVHSVMRVKLVLAGEGGGCTPTPSHYIYHHHQSCSVRSS